MEIRNYPFTRISPRDPPRPFLPVIVINPHADRHINILAMIDTGADECALPASFASILGHNLHAGIKRKIKTGNGETTAYAHTLRIQIQGFSTHNVLIDFMPNLYIPLLGVRSFLGKFVLSIDYTRQTFSLKLPTA